jgi:hypothetical protein
MNSWQSPRDRCANDYQSGAYRSDRDRLRPVLRNLLGQTTTYQGSVYSTSPSLPSSAQARSSPGGPHRRLSQGVPRVCGVHHVGSGYPALAGVDLAEPRRVLLVGRQWNVRRSPWGLVPTFGVWGGALDRRRQPDRRPDDEWETLNHASLDGCDANCDGAGVRVQLQCAPDPHRRVSLSTAV